MKHRGEAGTEGWGVTTRRPQGRQRVQGAKAERQMLKRDEGRMVAPNERWTPKVIRDVDEWIEARRVDG